MFAFVIFFSLPLVLLFGGGDGVESIDDHDVVEFPTAFTRTSVARVDASSVGRT